MANISHFTQTVNGVSTTYDIHDANAVPRSGGAVLGGTEFRRTTNNEWLSLHSSSDGNGSYMALESGGSPDAGVFAIHARTTPSDDKILRGSYTGTLTWGSKNVAMREDVVPRSGGAVMTGRLAFSNNASIFSLSGGTAPATGGSSLNLYGKDRTDYPGGVIIQPAISTNDFKNMIIKYDGTWTWNGTACQITSDQRLKQQITEIDDKLLDAWQDVDLVQFKYNDAVDTKKDKARLHTGYVVQQIDSACKSHGVDISEYGLYCHEEYPEETEEVEVEQADGTKVKEKKIIREASEHYSLRYTEVYAVECMYLRRCIERLTARIEQLEKGNKEMEK